VKLIKRFSEAFAALRKASVNGTHGYKSNVKIIRRDKLGNVVATHKTHNIIVLAGRTRDTDILYGTQTTNLSISKIKVGKGGAPGGDPFNPIPPTDNDTGLAIAIAAAGATRTIQAAEKSKPAATTIRYDFIFQATNINDYVNEAVLTFADDACFARHTFPSQPLLSAYGGSIEIIWEISNVNIG
jgi:hypothetical protein